MLAKQTEITSAIGTTDERLVEAGKRLKELNVASDSQVKAESTGKRANVLKQMGEELTALGASRKLLGELLSKVQEDAIAKAAGPGDLSLTMTQLITSSVCSNSTLLRNTNGGTKRVKPPNLTQIILRQKA